MAAMVTTISTAYTMVLTTERANDIMFIPTRFKDCLAAFSLRVEVGGKFVDAIETAEVNHKSQILRFLYYIYLELGRLFHKSPDFFDYFSGTYGVFIDNRYIVPFGEAICLEIFDRIPVRSMVCDYRGAVLQAAPGIPVCFIPILGGFIC